VQVALGPKYLVRTSLAKETSDYPKSCDSVKYIITRLSITKRTQVVSALVEGNSINAIVRMTGYNFVRVHKTLRVTPAMEAGIAGHVWSIEELVSLLDAKVVARAA